jgi:anti-sigma factor ChrR (cupin superfamily)
MIEFDDLELALAQSVPEAEPGAHVKERLLAAIRREPSPLPPGFSFILDSQAGWLPHPVPGIRMKILALNKERGYATLLLDVAPGTRFPAHHHSGAEECYVISGTLTACGRTIGAGDFHHADGDTDHGELSTETGCRVLLVVAPDDYVPGDSR